MRGGIFAKFLLPKGKYGFLASAIQGRSHQNLECGYRQGSIWRAIGVLKQILSEFLRLDGVSAAVVVGRDGFVIESAVSGKIDIEALGAMASTGVGTSEAMGTELKKGQLTQLLVETEKGPILLSPLSADELIAIVADNATVIGRIRYDLKKNRERIIAAL
jgi:predicted regulator of Ras-like GTPase activity (Roadblock/LC7/MglB family)